MQLITAKKYNKCVAYVNSKVGNKVVYKNSIFTIANVLFVPTLQGYGSKDIGYHEVEITKKNGEKITVLFSDFANMKNYK